MTLKKISENPFIPLIGLADVLYNWADRAVKAFQIKDVSMSIFGGTNWFEIIIRIVILYLLWGLYKRFSEYKAYQEVEIQKLKDRTIETIRALQKITHNADSTLLDLWVESRDRQKENLAVVAELLSELTGKKVKTKEEHPEITKDKGIANEKLDEIEDPLYGILDNWEENTK